MKKIDQIAKLLKIHPDSLFRSLVLDAVQAKFCRVILADSRVV